MVGTPPPCRGGGPQGRRGFPPPLPSRMAHRTAIMAAAWRTKGSLRPTWRTERPLWPPHGTQKSRYAPVGVRPPPPLRGSSPCEAGQSYHFRPIYNKVSSPSYVRILENPHFFEKKVPESLPESKKRRTFAPAIRKTTCCGNERDH